MKAGPGYLLLFVGFLIIVGAYLYRLSPAPPGRILTFVSPAVFYNWFTVGVVLFILGVLTVVLSNLTEGKGLIHRYWYEAPAYTKIIWIFALTVNFFGFFTGILIGVPVCFLFYLFFKKMEKDGKKRTQTQGMKITTALAIVLIFINIIPLITGFYEAFLFAQGPELAEKYFGNVNEFEIDLNKFERNVFLPNLPEADYFFLLKEKGFKSSIYPIVTVTFPDEGNIGVFVRVC